ncbi:DUF4244 domain-containing protein [Pseudarthrobacter phenanthrenivorans]|uniref:DUF4244 domain-containing protein n=1 Tax=Micrococcaceae TaxID=1268 RepID=UPI00240F7B94|nr:DUF4244 domain-containing protein [Arthrobacter sp. NQ7]MDJ0455627.1 DUF4244 domain-containing protein [Arthrobacter sp. NQ7]
MSSNRYRRHYSAGTSALALSRQRRGEGDSRMVSTGMPAVPPPPTATAAAGRTSTMSATITSATAPLPGNVVELYPGSSVDPKARRSPRLWASEAGMATAEYAIATLAAVGFAGLLVFILRSDEVRGFLLNLIRTALALP